MNITELKLRLKENSKLNLDANISDADGYEKLYIQEYPYELREYYNNKQPNTIATVDMESVGMLSTEYRGMYELSYSDMKWLIPILVEFTLTEPADREDPDVYIVEVTKTTRLNPDKEKPKGTLVYKRGDGSIDSDFRYYHQPIELVGELDFLFTVNELIELNRKDLIPLIKPLGLTKSEVIKIKQERSER